MMYTQYNCSPLYMQMPHAVCVAPDATIMSNILPTIVILRPFEGMSILFSPATVSDAMDRIAKEPKRERRWKSPEPVASRFGLV